MKIHLQGMGLLGSIIAWHLEERCIPFVWSDIDANVCAWRASTGCVYPSGDNAEFDAYVQWREWNNGGAPWSDRLGHISETAAYWFLTKNPPHGAKYGIANQVGKLRMGTRPTVQVNVQRFVEDTRRAFFARHWTGEPATDSTVVVSHGYDRRRLSHFKWGWSAKVKLEVAPEILWKSEVFGRPNLYLKRGAMSFLIYAYPVPGEPEHWYAGSSVIRQTTPKALEVEKKFAFWKRCVEETSEGAVKVLEASYFSEGWRPCAKDDDTEFSRWIDGQLVVRPMSHSGVRLSPLVVDDVLGKLNLKGNAIHSTGNAA